MAPPPRPSPGQRPLVASEGISDDVLANSITILEALKDAASAVGVVPFLGGIIATALGIAKAVEQSRANTDAFVFVAERAATLAEYVQEKTLGSNGGTISTDMQVILQELHRSVLPSCSWNSLVILSGHSALVKVQHTVNRELQRGRIHRFFRRAKLRGKAQECLQKLEDAWHSFDSAILVRLERQVESLQRQGESLQGKVESLKGQVELQATFEPGCLVSASALPTTALFSQLLSDIQRTEAHTKIPYRTRTHHGYQYSAILGTRPVTVRTYGHKLKDNVFESIQMYSENNHESHETFNNVIAMAYPHAGVQFYVLDGSLRRSILTDFDSNDPVVWIEKLCQHDETVIPAHKGPCLPSAGIDSHGQLIFDVQDLEHGNASCLFTCIYGLYSEACDYVSRSNLSRLWDFVARQIPLHSLEIADNDAKPGDYGYITNHPDGPRFAYLGNIDDVFESSVDIVEEFTIVPSQNDPGRWCIGQVFLSGIPDDTYDKFFTNHALRLSRLHGIDLSDLFLVQCRNYGAWVCTGEDHTHGTHTTAWLHKQPLDEHGVPHKPWAYWSFDEEPVPVGHPPPDVPQGPGCFWVEPPRLYASGLGPFLARMNVMLAEASERDRHEYPISHIALAAHERAPQETSETWPGERVELARSVREGRVQACQKIAIGTILVSVPAPSGDGGSNALPSQRAVRVRAASTAWRGAIAQRERGGAHEAQLKRTEPAVFCSAKAMVRRASALPPPAVIRAATVIGPSALRLTVSARRRASIRGSPGCGGSTREEAGQHLGMKSEYAVGGRDTAVDAYAVIIKVAYTARVRHGARMGWMSGGDGKVEWREREWLGVECGPSLVIMRSLQFGPSLPLPFPRALTAEARPMRSPSLPPHPPSALNMATVNTAAAPSHPASSPLEWCATPSSTKLRPNNPACSSFLSPRKSPRPSRSSSRAKLSSPPPLTRSRNDRPTSAFPIMDHRSRNFSFNALRDAMCIGSTLPFATTSLRPQTVAAHKRAAQRTRESLLANELSEIELSRSAAGGILNRPVGAQGEACIWADAPDVSDAVGVPVPLLSFVVADEVGVVTDWLSPGFAAVDDVRALVWPWLTVTPTAPPTTAATRKISSHLRVLYHGRAGAGYAVPACPSSAFAASSLAGRAHEPSYPSRGRARGARPAFRLQG
ncbi:uncharacterized protein BXZ73DRAFT_78931 [Epithele typhae]|uniref:uncharacterized protein n=1 Tax=Epithele typhae TaxID=378194 RepID=UPI0020075D97|nr:uncharacterized protein BXZ73DRAFT_78931 [Epithele typhae]KAH9925589.1 hypothetical protein BXZ73DRAFT_78931 [Epithele typhae]